MAPTTMIYSLFPPKDSPFSRSWSKMTLTPQTKHHHFWRGGHDDPLLEFDEDLEEGKQPIFLLIHQPKPRKQLCVQLHYILLKLAQVKPQLRKLAFNEIMSLIKPLISSLTLFFLRASISTKLSDSTIIDERSRFFANKRASQTPSASATRRELSNFFLMKLLIRYLLSLRTLFQSHLFLMCCRKPHPYWI